jgi:protein gp37
MKMGRTKIEWTDDTKNPIVGCTHNCSYCYARQQAKRQKHRCHLCYIFVPHPHLERLDKITPRQKPKKIFIDSMWDWGCSKNERWWLEKILEKMVECQQHTFQILSKRPKFYRKWSFPQNVWLGTSITDNSDTYRIHDLDKAAGSNLQFVSIEPIHQRINFWFSKIDWVIVGAETRNAGRIIPEEGWIHEIINNCKAENIPLFIKDNVGWPEKIQEFPEK